MKAIRIHRCAGLAQLRLEDCDPPERLQEDQVLVGLKAAAVNRIDLELRSGKPLRGSPRIPGADGSGIVQAVGARVQGIAPGDPVCLFPFQECGVCLACLHAGDGLCARPSLLGVECDGSYAEYVRVPARNCVPAPAHFSFEEAAAFPLVYLMAWRMLVSDARLQPGEWVLIGGAGGGVATAALQLAVAFGARVIVLSRHEKKLTRARELGAACGILLHDGDPFRAVRAYTGKRGVDIAVDCVGGATWAESLAALARGGRLVTCGALGGSAPQTDLRRVFWNHLRILATRSADRKEFEQVVAFLAATRRKPVIDSVFPLRDAAAAHERLARGEQFGKIVLRTEG